MSTNNGSKESVQQTPELNFASHNRRKDARLRNAIAQLEELLYDQQSQDLAINIALSHLADISKSEYSVYFTDRDLASSSGNKKANITVDMEDASPEFINKETLKSWVNKNNLLTSSVFYNAPIPSATRALLKPDVDIHSLMIIPIALNKRLRAIFIFANTSLQYTGSMLVKLMPVIGALICVLKSCTNAKGEAKIRPLGISETRAEPYLNSLVASSPVGIILVNENAVIMQNNLAAQEMFYPNVDVNSQNDSCLQGINIHHFFPDYESFFQWSQQYDRFGAEDAKALPKSWNNKVALRYDGKECVVNLTIFRHSTEHGRITTLQVQDITSIRNSAGEHKQILQQLNALTQLVPVAILRVTHEWDCVFANAMWSEFSGLSERESAGRAWINAIHPDDVETLLEALRNCLLSATDHSQEVRIISPLGATKWVDFSSRILFDSDGSVEGFIGTCNDITERFVNQEKLRQIAEYDSLTGLANRLLFGDRMQQAYFNSERDNSVISIFFLDIDGFKDVNDTLGHNIGDLLLQRVAERLTNTLRKNDTIARFGGDEFVVMLGREDHLSEAILVAEKVIQSIAKPYLIDEHEIFITTSLGIAQGSFNDSSPESLLKDADIALYSAKKSGKNKYRLFNEELEQGARKRLKLLGELRHGLRKNQFSLDYQAICESKHRHIVGFETLIRFNSNEDGIVQPDDFIKLLEESNMIIEVGAWVFEQTCKQLSRWSKDQKIKRLPYLSFNVSAKQLFEPQFVSSIKACCEKYDVAPNKLVMELTESVLILKPHKVQHILTELKEFGIRIALDDFGTGYSSLSYLQNLPVDIIKIDKSFLSDLDDLSSGTNIIKTIIAMAASMNLKVIAEGVESELALNKLVSLNVDMFQGFFINKPLPIEKANTLLLKP